MKNENISKCRRDMTKWLIHFVKKVNHSNLPAKTDDEYKFFSKDELEDGTSAFEVLRNIIRTGGIFARSSFRNGVTTLFGEDKVVCATEMPLYSFYKYAQKRCEAGNVSPIGVAFLKSQFFGEGGRHAIYGLSKKLEYEPKGKTCYYRILKDSCLPKDEQYRLVSIELNGLNWNDWSHEREWRWKATEPHHKIFSEDNEGVINEYQGLPLFGREKKCKIDRLVIILKDEKQVEIVKRDLTRLYIAKSNKYDTLFSQKVIKKTRLINMSEIAMKIESDNYHHYETIEGIEKKKLAKPLILAKPATPKQKIYLKKQLDSALKKALNSPVKNGHGACGRCRVLTDDITNKKIQKLISAGLVGKPYDDPVVIHTGMFGSCDIDENEQRAEIFKKELKKYYGDIFYLDSQLD